MTPRPSAYLAGIYEHPERPGRWALLETLAAHSPSLGVVYSYSRILWPELIELFPCGIVNLHGGPLPEYRGANVLQWAIIQGETQTAMSLHYVDAGVDTGPVIDQHPVTISPDDTALSVRSKLDQATRSLLRKWVRVLVQGRVPARTQDESRARVWPRRRPADGLIDWSWDDRRICNFIRALAAPWPGAFYVEPTGRQVIVDRPLSPEQVAELRKRVQA